MHHCYICVNMICLIDVHSYKPIMHHHTASQAEGTNPQRNRKADKLINVQSWLLAVDGCTKYTYTIIYRQTQRERERYIYIYIYTYVCMYVYVCIYIYIYIYIYIFLHTQTKPTCPQQCLPDPPVCLGLHAISSLVHPVGSTMEACTREPSLRFRVYGLGFRL